MSMQNMKRSETTEQIALFNWAKRTESILPELALMYHVPNEGKRSNGGILKAAGLKSGVPDICLPVANNGFHGLYIELKFGKNKATKAQEEYMAMLNAQGYKTAVCVSTLPLMSMPSMYEQQLITYEQFQERMTEIARNKEEARKAIMQQAFVRQIGQKIQNRVKINDFVHIPAHKVARAVKSA